MVDKISFSELSFHKNRWAFFSPGLNRFLNVKQTWICDGVSFCIVFWFHRYSMQTKSLWEHFQLKRFKSGLLNNFHNTTILSLSCCVCKLYRELRQLTESAALAFFALHFCVLYFYSLIFRVLFSSDTQWSNVSNPFPTQVFRTSCCTRRASCLCCDSTGSSQTCPSALKASGFQPSKNTGVYGATGPRSWELREQGGFILSFFFLTKLILMVTTIICCQYKISSYNIFMPERST